jgi:NAD(P)-dependent dehydrogenase (short-subunit alcohol dehydrogenase family)
VPVDRVALVSGANRGIGREIVRQLAERGHTVILGARDLEKGAAVAEALQAELSDPAGGDERIVPMQLDVADDQSVDRLARDVESRFGRLDVLVNNAGIGNDDGQRGADADLERVQEALDTNLFGAWRLSRAFIPLMQRGGYGRIVNISTGMGQLSDMGGGFPGYRVSKTALNALTRILASELQGQDLKVNSACPGWVRTDMGGRGAPRSVEEGADTPVWLATLPDDGPSGGFFRNREPIPW